MAWLWNSWEEYSDYVEPVSARRPLFNIAKNASAFKAQRELQESMQSVKKALDELQSLGFSGRDNQRRPGNLRVLKKARPLVRELVHAGEKLLIYHKRLAQSDYAYGFLHQHTLGAELDMYLDGWGIVMEIDQ